MFLFWFARRVPGRIQSTWRKDQCQNEHGQCELHFILSSSIILKCSILHFVASPVGQGVQFQLGCMRWHLRSLLFAHALHVSLISFHPISSIFTHWRPLLGSCSWVFALWLSDFLMKWFSELSFSISLLWNRNSCAEPNPLLAGAADSTRRGMTGWLKKTSDSDGWVFPYFRLWRIGFFVHPE